MKFNDYFKSVPVLETDRLILRPFVYDDKANYMQIICDEEVVKYLGNGISIPKNNEAFERWIKNINGRILKTKLAITWCIENKDDKQVIGRIDLGGYVKKSMAELSYYLSKKYWNLGLTTEAVSKIIKFGFDDLKLHRIQAVVLPENVASLKVLDKNGFKQEGILRRYSFGQEFHDAVMLSIICEENIGANIK